MPPYPTLRQVISHLTARLGAPTDAGPELIRWWVRAQPGGEGVGLWMHCPAGQHRDAPPAKPCEVWITRPFVEERERCPVTSMQHLDEFVDRVLKATRGGSVAEIGGFCEPETEPPPRPSNVA